MKKFRLFFLAAALLVAARLRSDPVGMSPATAPARIELRDQFGVPQTLVFPTTNFTVLLIADRHGSEQVNQWIAALKPKCAGYAQIRGLAQVAGVPRIFQGRLCREFQAQRKYPVMMDWSGRVCEQFEFKPGTVNVLIIDPRGFIQGRFYGNPTESDTAAALKALEIPGRSRSLKSTSANPKAKITPQ